MHTLQNLMSRRGQVFPQGPELRLRILVLVSGRDTSVERDVYGASLAPIIAQIFLNPQLETCVPRLQEKGSIGDPRQFRQDRRYLPYARAARQFGRCCPDASPDTTSTGSPSRALCHRA